MKAKLQHSLTLGAYKFDLESAFYARYYQGQWLVKLNYHRLHVVVTQQEQDNDTPTFPGLYDLIFQSSSTEGLLQRVLLGIHLFGVASTVVSLIAQVLEALLDVQSLIDKVLDALGNQLQKMLLDQEPLDLTTPIKNTIFILNLMKNGAHQDRRLPRWRTKITSTLE